MGNYYHSHVRRLTQEARKRFDRLVEVLTPHAAIHHPVNDKEVISINGCDVRLAVDDFKTILAEIRRLK